MIDLNSRALNKERQAELDARAASIDLRVAVPGIVQAFNAEEQTVTVQVAIREKLCDEEGNEVWTDIPLLVDVPIVVPRAGGYVLTLPVQQGDECLVVFADSCIDAWWQSGGVQNQIDCRRHDLSDGFAILGCWSQPKVVPAYSTNSVQIRNESGSASLEIKGDVINIKASAVNITGTTTIEGIPWMGHKHGGVKAGGDKTGGVAG